MLTQEEIDKCREAFERFDKDGSGTIDAWELKETLKAMGQNPTDEEVFQMLSQERPPPDPPPLPNHPPPAWCPQSGTCSAMH
ncbi:hypothetical protein T484DRAFT_1669656 [Baffinella frigidus]|nr:hypothetical protein T484DRAFT_1669656 [Cryptophyta sp. CCMP2293]